MRKDVVDVLIDYAKANGVEFNILQSSGGDYLVELDGTRYLIKEN